MLRNLAATLAIFLSAAVMGQSIVDSSAQAVPPDDLKQVLRLIASQTRDTTGVQGRGLYKASGNGYCGQVKASGAYTDWSPFHANTFTNSIWIPTKASGAEGYEDIQTRLAVFGCLKRR